MAVSCGPSRFLVISHLLCTTIPIGGDIGSSALAAPKEIVPKLMGDRSCAGFTMVLMVFLWFPYGFNGFPMVSRWFPYGFNGFPMVSLWFPYGFNGFPMGFLWFSYGFPQKCEVDPSLAPGCSPSGGVQIQRVQLLPWCCHRGTSLGSPVS